MKLSRAFVIAMATSAVLLVAGCGGSSSGSATATRTVTATVTAAGSASVSSPAASSSSAAKALAVGNPYSDAEVTATVIAYDDAPQASGSPQDGERYAALQIKVCLTAGGPVGSGAWALVGADGGFYTIQVSGGGLPQPAYGDTTLAPAGCATGWITYSIPTATKVVQARYTPTAKDGTKSIVLWQLA